MHHADLTSGIQNPTNFCIEPKNLGNLEQKPLSHALYYERIKRSLVRRQGLAYFLRKTIDSTILKEQNRKSEAASEIPDSSMLWYSDDTTHTAKHCAGVKAIIDVNDLQTLKVF